MAENGKSVDNVMSRGDKAGDMNKRTKSKDDATMGELRRELLPIAYQCELSYRETECLQRKLDLLRRRLFDLCERSGKPE